MSGEYLLRKNICDMLFNKCITDKNAEFKILTGTYKYNSADNTHILNCVNNLEKCYVIINNKNYFEELKNIYKSN